MTRGFLALSMSLLALSGCDSLATIPYRPELTPQSWLTIQPFVAVTVGMKSFILVQPSSTVFVYLLGITAILAGLNFLRLRGGHQSRRWWGIALALWGMGALFAGTSYQAFSYEIKCAGQTVCSWTSWWEIGYLLLSVASVDAMVVAVAFSSLAGRQRRLLINYAWLNLVLYATLVLVV